MKRPDGVSATCTVLRVWHCLETICGQFFRAEFGVTADVMMSKKNEWEDTAGVEKNGIEARCDGAQQIDDKV